MLATLGRAAIKHSNFYWSRLQTFGSFSQASCVGSQVAPLLILLFALLLSRSYRRPYDEVGIPSRHVEFNFSTRADAPPRPQHRIHSSPRHQRVCDVAGDAITIVIMLGAVCRLGHRSTWRCESPHSP